MSCSTRSTVIPPSQTRRMSARGFPSRGIQTAGRLVEQQQLRIRGQRARQFHHSPLSEGEGRPPGLQPVGPDRPGPGAPARHHGWRVLPSLAREAKTAGDELPARAAVPAHHHIFQNVHPQEQARVLKCPGDPGAGDLVRFKAADAAVLESDSPASGLRRPEMILNRVVLPAPLGPMTALIRPRAPEEQHGPRPPGRRNCGGHPSTSERRHGPASFPNNLRGPHFPMPCSQRLERSFRGQRNHQNED